MGMILLGLDSLMTKTSDTSTHTRPRLGAARLRSVSGLAWALIASLLALTLSQAQELDQEDVEGRIDYAFYTEDASGLRNVAAEIAAAVDKGGDSTAARYYAGFAQYRLGLVLAARKQSEAADAMSRCVDEVEHVLDSDGKDVEALVLQAACYGQLAALRGVTAMINAPLSNSRLEKVAKVAPRNP